MLLKFTTTDMFNTSLVNVATGERAYDITTITVPEKPEKVLSPREPFSSSKTRTTSKDFSPIKEYPVQPEKQDIKVVCRQTKIMTASGQVVADVFWEGRHPKITIDGENIGGLNDLFGSSSVRFMPKALAIPTKFDSDYVWTATTDELKLVDYSTEEVKGTFHQNVLRFPRPMKGLKPKATLSAHLTTPSSPNLARPPPKSIFRSSSRIFSPKSSPPPSIEETPLKDCVKSTFVPTHVPGFGSNYLEFTPHPFAKDVEIILSFLIMEILRRGRFSLTPYTFENPTIWQLKEVRDLVLRRIRRNTV